MPELILYLRGRELRRVPVMASEVTIGRDEGADVVIDNAGVSRTHAVLTYRDGAFRIRDASSENGITLNGKPVTRSTLNYGDVIGINKYKLQFSADGGVPVDMLMPPTKQIGARPGNVVATMTVNAEAARKMQDQILAEKAQGAEDARSLPPTQTEILVNRLLAIALLLTLGGIAYTLYQRQSTSEALSPTVEVVGVQ